MREEGKSRENASCQSIVRNLSSELDLYLI